jgi:ribose transport system substrate-binding protein
MKQIAKGLSLFLCLIALAGCGQGEKAKEAAGPAVEKASPAPPAAKKRIGLVMKTLTNPFFIDMEKGARKAEVESGIELTVKTGAKETSIDQQIAIVEEMIRDRLDAIVIAPGSSTELVPVLKKAQDAGIPVVNIDNRLDPEACGKIGLTGVPFISVDNERGAYLAVRALLQKVTAPTQAVLLEGIRAAANARQRKEGALRAFKEDARIQVVAMETANWKIDEAAEVTAKLIGRHPRLGALFCANDMMALGAIQSLQKAKRKDVLMAGFDALEEAKKAIREGTLLVTVDQQAAVQGYLGIVQALDRIRGATPPAETMVDVKVITKADL